MRVSYSKEHRELAKKSEQRLYTIAFTGKGGKGGITSQGVCSESEAGVINDLIIRSFKFGSEQPKTEFIKED